MWRTGCDHVFGTAILTDALRAEGVTDPHEELEKSGFRFCPACGLGISKAEEAATESPGQARMRRSTTLAGIASRAKRRAEEQERDEALLALIREEERRESAVALYRERHPDSRASDEEAFEFVLKALDKAGMLAEER